MTVGYGGHTSWMEIEMDVIRRRVRSERSKSPTAVVAAMLMPAVVQAAVAMLAMVCRRAMRTS